MCELSVWQAEAKSLLKSVFFFFWKMSKKILM